MSRKLDDIKNDIAQLQTKIDERTAERLALGLPADPPSQFVKLSHTLAIVEKTKVVGEVLAQYLQMLNEGGADIPFPADTLTRYKPLLTLITWSENMTLARYGEFLQSAVELVESDEPITYERKVMQLYKRLDYADKFKELAEDMQAVTGEGRKVVESDEELDAVIVEYLTHYNEVVRPQIKKEKAILQTQRKDDE